MKYMGSKARFAKEILPIILKDRKEGQWFIDLFCGGCNLLDKVGGKRVGNDKNKYLIALWQGLQIGEDYPKTISKDLYSRARREFNNNSNEEFTDFMIGWIGWMGSYNGRFFDGGYSGHDVKGRDYIGEQIRNTEAQITLLEDVIFTCKDYKEMNLKEPCLIYCDIPYKDTKQYSSSKDFNHEEFWDWCRKSHKFGHTLFISEYQAPKDFKCVWSKEVTNSMNTTKTYRPTEKLFTL